MIGVFGDSFADVKPGEGWVTFLHKDIESHGASGTSHWWSYQQFLKHHQRYHTVIFIHTTNSRWPVLSDDVPPGWAYITGFQENYPEEMLERNRYFLEFFPDAFRQFISDAIFRSVNEICEQQGKHLINIMAYSHQESHERVKTSFPVFTHLDDVSRYEKISYNGDMMSVTEFLHEQRIRDTRICHLSRKNNEQLSRILQPFLSAGTGTNLIYNLMNYTGWQEQYQSEGMK